VPDRGPQRARGAAREILAQQRFRRDAGARAVARGLLALARYFENQKGGIDRITLSGTIRALLTESSNRALLIQAACRL